MFMSFNVAEMDAIVVVERVPPTPTNSESEILF